MQKRTASNRVTVIETTIAIVIAKVIIVFGDDIRGFLPRNLLPLYMNLL
jgi:hypothetical protein